jgi:PAS domain S-box-containing protein
MLQPDNSIRMHSLYRDLTIALSVLIMIVFGLLNLFDYLYFSRQVQETYQSKSADYSAYLRDSLELPLWDLDDELISKIGGAFSANAEISTLIIRDDQQRIVYQKEKNGVGDQIQQNIAIMHNGHPVGSVEIGLTLGLYEEHNRQMLLASILTLAPLIAVLVGATNLILSRMLRKPFDSVVAATKEMVAGRYHQIELPKTYQEFTPILAGFKTMTDAVASRESSLRQANEFLAAEISERKRGEADLRLLNERFALATTAGHMGIWDWDIESDKMVYDDCMYELYGIGREDFAGAYEAWLQSVHPDDRACAHEAVTLAKRGEREYDIEFRVVWPSGAIHYIKAYGQIVRDAQGKAQRMTGVNFDITRRKRAEEELRRLTLFQRTILNSAASGIISTTPDGIVTGFNPAAERLLGYAADEVVGKQTPALWHDTLEVEQYALRLSEELGEKIQPGFDVFTARAKRNLPEENEWTFVSKDGTRVPVNLLVTVLRGEDGGATGFVGLIHDLTERKRAEEELRRNKDRLEETVLERTAELLLARDAAEAANKAKSVFLSNMSHELRTPLNAILGFSNMMRREPQLTESQRENLDIINRSGEHLLALINDVLEMAKIEAGRVQAVIAPFDLGAMVRDVVDMMQLRAEEKGLWLLLDQSSAFPLYIKGDEARLRQVLVNLVGNAVKFTERGGVAIRLGVKQNARRHLVMEVEDTGPGVKLEEQKHLFQPFVQLAETGAQKGTGLGLAISRQFVRLMGGSIGVESTVGKGSIFRIELPVELADETSAAVRRGPAQAGEVVGLAPGQPAYRILIAEDDRENQLLLIRLMSNIGLEVKAADNGEQCVKLFQEWRPHLIWMDRRMPVVDGMEATRRIRQLPGGEAVKIVAVTASAFLEQRQELLDAGMDDVVRKPYRFHEIYDCLPKQLGIKYVYQAASPALVETAHIVLTPAMLAMLPAATREELKAALKSLRSERISAVIRQAGDVDAELGRALSRLAENLDYPAILDALASGEALAGDGELIGAGK